MTEAVLAREHQKRLNPYSTGSNSNRTKAEMASLAKFVLILILLEVTQIVKSKATNPLDRCLNPYSTGSNSNKFLQRLTTHTSS